MPIERPPLLGEVVPTFADRGCCVVSATDPSRRYSRFPRPALSYIDGVNSCVAQKRGRRTNSAFIFVTTMTCAHSSAMNVCATTTLLNNLYCTNSIITNGQPSRVFSQPCSEYWGLDFHQSARFIFQKMGVYYY
jgi:hypothetical protein